MFRSLSLSLLFAGCAVDATSVATSALKCGQWVCGENGAKMGIVPFDELHPTKTSSAGLRIKSFTKDDGTPMQLKVIGAKLYGFNGTSKWSGWALLDSKLVIDDEINAKQYDVTIVGVGFAEYYENGENPAGAGVQTYQFVFKELGAPGTPRDLCPLDTAKHWGPAHHAVIFGGDLYDEDKGEVSAIGPAAGEWFNVACVGDLKGKMLQQRLATAAQNKTFTSTLAHRNAAVRMLRADYCGTGEPHTITGVDLDWEHRFDGTPGWIVLDQAATLLNIEAIWNANGAVCLSKPRYATFAELAAAGCVKPACTQDDIDKWLATGNDWITIIP